MLPYPVQAAGSALVWVEQARSDYILVEVEQPYSDCILADRKQAAAVQVEQDETVALD